MPMRRKDMKVWLVFGIPLTYICILSGWLKDQSDAPSVQVFETSTSILRYTLQVLKQLIHFIVYFFTLLYI